jgi:hypothetical protein
MSHLTSVEIVKYAMLHIHLTSVDVSVTDTALVHYANYQQQ